VLTRLQCLLPKLVDLDNEVQRMKGSISIPGHSVGPHM
jgi:hypothetical protein